ncbi:Nuclear cap-binding protein subunit 2 [Fusarium oxysporum f. sp. albedinis]|nr:Nuclear cap-binding protein subunit 2 [Fusarium oxysporum f. sp. albedinis]
MGGKLFVYDFLKRNENKARKPRKNVFALVLWLCDKLKDTTRQKLEHGWLGAYHTRTIQGDPWASTGPNRLP